MLDSPCGVRVVLRPQPYELLQMMRTENGPVACQIIEIIHDDGHKQVDDEKRAKDVEGDEERNGEIIATCNAVIVGLGIALGLRSADAGEHYLLPRFTCRRAKENKNGLEKCLEMVVAMDLGVGIEGDLAEHLHADDGINKE